MNEPSNDSNVMSLRPVAPVVNELVIKMLEAWLAKARSGELLSVNLVGELTGSRWQTCGTDGADARAGAAMLIELALRKLGFVSNAHQVNEIK